jgi:Coenzyme PQQ synthesis protein D (PqqD)
VIGDPRHPGRVTCENCAPVSGNPNLKIRSDDLSWRQVEDEVIVLDLRSNEYLSINQSGTALWEMLVDGTTAETMSARLASDFGLEPDRSRTDVEAFIAMLAERGLLG